MNPLERIKYGTIDSIEEADMQDDDEELDAVNEMLDPQKGKTAEEKRKVYQQKAKTQSYSSMICGESAAKKLGSLSSEQILDGLRKTLK